ncbi:MAG TPA: HIRAN domain-containing protein [Deltaproteobacteria bacterium]|nr:HIRAN domain-containing protein [Deltaproteobacteria bacterium]HQJ08678.1 HIRAN domain-containing protein [Deltaproteobacteria bacterium]
MERRRFMKLITCLPLVSLYPASPIGSQDVPRYDPKNILLLQANVAGFRYYRGEKVWPRIHPGDAIILKREPHNPHDRKAIALYWHDEKLGYIPRTDNSVIANILDQGATLKASIRKKNLSKNSCQGMEIKVEIEC